MYNLPAKSCIGLLNGRKLSVLEKKLQLTINGGLNILTITHAIVAVQRPRNCGPIQAQHCYFKPVEVTTRANGSASEKAFIRLPYKEK